VKKFTVRQVITAILVFGFIITGLLDALLHGKATYSSIMGMDISRVYFYTFFLLVMGCWLLYNKWFAGIGFIALATFSSYFTEFIFVHNYFASVLIYIGIIIDIITRKKFKMLIPFIIIGIIQGLAFQIAWISPYIVGFMEFSALCIGSVFVIKNT